MSWSASLRAEASWDATVVSVEVPAERLAAALGLLAEVVREPAFPPREVERLRDQRLNDLLQAKADPARRADEVYLATVYDPASPYARPSGGLRDTVAGIDADAALNADVAARAKDFPDLEIVFADAQQDNAKQVADVENFLRQRIDQIGQPPLRIAQDADRRDRGLVLMLHRMPRWTVTA